MQKESRICLGTIHPFIGTEQWEGNQIRTIEVVRASRESEGRSRRCVIRQTRVGGARLRSAGPRDNSGVKTQLGTFDWRVERLSLSAAAAPIKRANGFKSEKTA